jgi:tetratricopeptide (TPR) repeat protein
VEVFCFIEGVSLNQKEAYMKVSKITAVSLVFVFVLSGVSFPAKVEKSQPVYKDPKEPADKIKSKLSKSLQYPKTYRIIYKLKAKIKEEPENHQNYELLAMAYDYIGLYEESAKALEKELKYYPKDDPYRYIIHSNLARVYLITDKLNEAKSNIDKALELKPENEILHRYLIKYYVLKGNYKKAAASLKKVSDLYPEKDIYHDIYAFMIDNCTNRPSEYFVEVFEEALRLNPDHYSAHRTYASALRDYGSNLEENFPKVLKEYKKSLKLKPDFIPTYISIADAYMFRALIADKDKYYDDALRWLNKAYEKDPDNPKLSYAMGTYYMQKKQYSKAIKKYEFAYSKGLKGEYLVNALSTAYNNKAYYLYKEGKDLKKGLKLVEKALSIQPEDGIFLGTKAELLYKMGKYKEAHKYIKKALSISPDHEEMQQDLKNIEKALGKQ